MAQPSDRIREARLIFDSFVELGKDAQIGKTFKELLKGTEKEVLQKKDNRFQDIITNMLGQSLNNAIQLGLHTLSSRWKDLISEVTQGMESGCIVTNETIKNIQKIQKVILSIESELNVTTQENSHECIRSQDIQHILFKSLPKETQAFCNVHTVFVAEFTTFVSQVLNNVWGSKAYNNLSEDSEKKKIFVLFFLDLLSRGISLNSIKTSYGTPTLQDISEEEEKVLLQQCVSYNKLQLATLVFGKSDEDLFLERLTQIVTKNYVFVLHGVHIMNLLRIQAFPNNNDLFLAVLNAIRLGKLIPARLLTMQISCETKKEFCSKLIIIFHEGKDKDREQLVTDSELANLVTEVLAQEGGQKAVTYAVRTASEKYFNVSCWLGTYVGVNVLPEKNSAASLRENEKNISELSEDVVDPTWLYKVSCVVQALAITDSTRLDGFIKSVLKKSALCDLIASNSIKSYELSNPLFVTPSEKHLRDYEQKIVVEDVLLCQAAVCIAQYDVIFALQRVEKIRISTLKNEAYVAIAKHMASYDLQQAQRILHNIQDEACQILGYQELLSRCFELSQETVSIKEDIFRFFKSITEIVKRANTERVFVAYSYIVLSIIAFFVERRDQTGLERFNTLLSAISNENLRGLCDEFARIISQVTSDDYSVSLLPRSLFLQSKEEKPLKGANDISSSFLNELRDPDLIRDLCDNIDCFILDMYLGKILREQHVDWLALFRDASKSLSASIRDSVLGRLTLQLLGQDIMVCIAVSILVEDPYLQEMLRSTIISEVMQHASDKTRTEIEMRVENTQMEFKSSLGYSLEIQSDTEPASSDPEPPSSENNTPSYEFLNEQKH